ncbi:hypothetical protein Tco_0292120 [Tanacetum coccineum]
MDEMMSATTTFLRGVMDVANQSRKKGPPSWKHHKAASKPSFEKKPDFKGWQRSGRRHDKFTPLIKKVKEIMATNTVMIKAPLPMSSSAENRNRNKFSIVFDDTSDAALSCEPTVSPLDNNEIDFEISFDESDDEDYMVIFNENSFSCKIISVDNLKTDSEDENDKVNMPSSLSPEPMFGYIDNLDFFKYFKNEFPAIAYNDLKSKSDPLVEPSVSSQRIDNFETSLPECDENEQNVLYLNDSFPLKVIFSNNPMMTISI